jgi:hypothetical protein
VRVSSIPALLTALDNNSVTDIVVAKGTYRISRAAYQEADSLWIGARFADRTNPVTVRAETRGGVIFDGGGANAFGGITFVAGAHHQTWDGFTWTNGTPSDEAGSGTGVVVFGGYAGLAAPHHITLLNSTVRPTRGDGRGHAVYFSWAVTGPHDIVFDNFTVDDPNGYSMAGLHFYHSDSTNLNAWNVTVRNSHLIGTQQAVMLWDRTLHDIVIEDTTITGAADYGVRYELPGRYITLSHLTSTDSGAAGFYSSLGDNPPGVTFIANSFN